MFSIAVKVSRIRSCKKAAAWVAALFFASSFQTSAAVNGTAAFSHYQPILEKNIFGRPPEPENTNVTDTAETVIEEDPYIIPPGLANVKVTLLSRYRGIPAAGFTDGDSNTPYYLLEGQAFNDFTLVKVDLVNATIRLRRGSSETDLPLWINPATTNQGDIATFGMKAGSERPKTVTAVAVKTPIRPPALSAEDIRRRDDLRARREEARAKREEERKAQAESLAKLTPEEREQRLHDLNVDLIVNNSGPPLPIELDKKDMEKLSKAGFEVPGFNAPEKEPEGAKKP